MSLIALLLVAAQHDGQGAAPAACLPEHAAMGHCEAATAERAGTDLPAGDASTPPPPRVDAADARFGADAMAKARRRMFGEHGGGTFSKVMVDRAEFLARDGKDGYAWEAEAWFGGDIDRLVLKSDGEGDIGGALEQGEVQALWSHAVGPYFNLQAGVRQDFAGDAAPTHAVLGIEGLAPYWLEVDAALFLSHKGDVTARAEASYDQRITQRLILQPMAEFNAALQDVPERGVGRGPTSIELGLRLRYEIAREVAPYIGVNWERALGRTARRMRAAGEDPSRPALVAGVHVWF